VLTMRSLRPAKPALDPALARVAAGTAAPALTAGDAGMTADAVCALGSGEGERHQQVVIAGPEALAPIVLREVANPVRDQVVAIIEQRPEAATRVVRNWLKQD